MSEWVSEWQGHLLSCSGQLKRSSTCLCWKWTCFLFIENFFIMPVTLMHQSRIVITQWQRTQISKEKIPNLFIWKCSFHFVLSCFDCCLPPSFDRLPPYLVHWLHAGVFCLCLVQLSADFLFHIRCSGIHRERCRCCKKISKWTVALILGFPGRIRCIFISKVKYVRRSNTFNSYTASFSFLCNNILSASALRSRYKNIIRM